MTNLETDKTYSTHGLPGFAIWPENRWVNYRPGEQWKGTHATLYLFNSTLTESALTAMNHHNLYHLNQPEEKKTFRCEVESHKITGDKSEYEREIFVRKFVVGHELLFEGLQEFAEQNGNQIVSYYHAKKELNQTIVDEIIFPVFFGNQKGINNNQGRFGLDIVQMLGDECFDSFSTRDYWASTYDLGTEFAFAPKIKQVRCMKHGHNECFINTIIGLYNRRSDRSIETEDEINGGSVLNGIKIKTEMCHDLTNDIRLTMKEYKNSTQYARIMVRKLLG
jgi:hypothetical protein